jgi:hypothetical protein
MLVRVALERRHRDIRIADEAVELGALLFVKPLRISVSRAMKVKYASTQPISNAPRRYVKFSK